jgi:hypothetical protein
MPATDATHETRMTYEALCRAPESTLETLMLRGTAPRLEQLQGYEFRGFNVHPGAEIIRSRKFKKGFYAEPGVDDLLQGYNVRVAQNGLLNPWIDVLRRGEPIREFPYEAYPVRQGVDDRYPQSLFLDYGLASKSALDPSMYLRDYLAQVYLDNADLFIGRAFYALGPVWLPLSYMVLERYNKAL